MLFATFQRMIRAAGTSAPTMRKGLLTGAAGAVVQGTTFAVLFPLFQALLAPETPSGRIVFYCLLILGLVILDGFLRFMESGYDWDTQVKAGHEARIRLGEQLRRMPLEYLQSRQAGDLNVVLSGDVNDVVMIMSGLYGMVLHAIIAPLTTIAICLFIDWRIALALAALFPLAIPVYQKIRAASARENRVSSEAHAQVTANLVEYTQGLAVLRATRQVGKRSRRLQDSLADLRAKQSTAADWGVVPNIALSTIVQVGIMVVTALGIILVLGGNMNLGVLLALLVVSVRFAEPLSMFAAMAKMFDFMEAGLERIDALLSVPAPPVIPSRQTPAAFDIRFENLTFAYAGQTDDAEPEPVLHDIDFHVPARSLMALVGPSGSGKTTIIRLITRYADPQAGTVKIGGVDIRSMTPSELMRHISVVFQDVYLFDDTIGNNIRMAARDADHEAVMRAARAANCHDFITCLPSGYDTPVGEIGGALSGGERQRISIARAILKDAPIVLLDEPTSALDTESEVAVQRAIDRLVADKTVVIIAHRLSTVMAADTILVVENGRIAERGTHRELLAQNGRYASMWRVQTASRQWQFGTGLPLVEASH